MQESKSIAFLRARNGALWVPILEKAYAKLYGSYKRIEGGFPDEVIHDLTGAPVHYVPLNDENFDKDETWEYLADSSDRQYVIVASTPER